MYAVQSGAVCMDPDSLALGSDSDSVDVGAGSDILGTCDPGDVGHIGQVVHSGVHYYIDVSNSEESAYQTCDRNVQIDQEFQHYLQEEYET